MKTRLLRLPKVLDIVGDGRSTLYARIADGVFPAGINLGPRMRAWPENEVDAIVAARIRGVSHSELRELVKQLHEARKAAAA